MDIYEKISQRHLLPSSHADVSIKVAPDADRNQIMDALGDLGAEEIKPVGRRLHCSVRSDLIEAVGRISGVERVSKSVPVYPM